MRTVYSQLVAQAQSAARDFGRAVKLHDCHRAKDALRRYTSSAQRARHDRDPQPGDAKHWRGEADRLVAAIPRMQRRLDRCNIRKSANWGR